MWGDEEWCRRRDEREAREAQLDAEQWEEGSRLEALLVAAETDREAARVVALARLLHPDCFAQREQGLAAVARDRAGPKGNDPDRQRAIRVHERVARLAISYAISQARAVMGLVSSWEREA